MTVAEAWQVKIGIGAIVVAFLGIIFGGIQPLLFR
jgi:hypothetical protein